MRLIHPPLACAQTRVLDVVPTRTEIIDRRLVYGAINKALAVSAYVVLAHAVAKLFQHDLERFVSPSSGSQASPVGGRRFSHLTQAHWRRRSGPVKPRWAVWVKA